MLSFGIYHGELLSSRQAPGADLLGKEMGTTWRSFNKVPLIEGEGIIITERWSGGGNKMDVLWTRKWRG